MELASTTWGTGPRRALLLHGIGSNKEGWWRVGPSLAGQGYTVSAPDLRGHGASPKANRYLLADYAADVADTGPWDLILGHSMGGAVAVTLLADDPVFAVRAVLEDPALFLPAPDVSLPMLLEDFDAPLTVGEQQRRNPTWHPEDTRIKTEALGQCGRDVVERTITDNGSWNLVAAAAGLGVPTLVLGAGIDPITPPELGAGLVALNPRVTFVEIPGSSHSMHRDEFDATMDAIGGWLA